jgi:hypothetical protein
MIISEFSRIEVLSVTCWSSVYACHIDKVCSAHQKMKKSLAKDSEAFIQERMSVRNNILLPKNVVEFPNISPPSQRSKICLPLGSASSQALG